ncbi:hypothetical protein [Streptomyces sp. NPDC054865]
MDRHRVANPGVGRLPVVEHRGSRTRGSVPAGGSRARRTAWPRHPGRDLHDWTQEGRELRGRFPEPSYAERDAQAEALLAAHADRWGMNRQLAVARLEQGGKEYRQLLDKTTMR